MLPLLLTMIFVVGACSKKSGNQTDEMKEKARETYESTQKSMQDSKEDFVKNVQAQLNAIDKQMEEIKSNIDQKSGKTKQELQKEWEGLKEKRQNLLDKLAELKTRSEENWQDLKKDINNQLSSMKDSFNGLKNKLGLKS